MITYWDTSAVIPLLIREPSSDTCRRLWDSSSTAVTTLLLYVEASAALHQAHRLSRIDSSQLDELLTAFETYWDSLVVLGMGEGLIRHAAKLSGLHGLRGYDAVHCAAGLSMIDDADAVLVSGDKKLLDAWRVSGAVTADIGAGS